MKLRRLTSEGEWIDVPIAAPGSPSAQRMGREVRAARRRGRGGKVRRSVTAEQLAKRARLRARLEGPGGQRFLRKAILALIDRGALDHLPDEED